MDYSHSKICVFFRPVLILVAICIQMYIVIPATSDISIAGDMIFTYTLANNSYSPLFFNEDIIETIPNSNGWFDASVLREWYLVNDYDQFDYKGVYWHQRIDVHPPLYYFLVHTICSLFPNTYSNMYAGSINILGILLIDLLFILLFKEVFEEYVYAALPILLLTLQYGFVSQIFNLRMYTMLAAACLWYLYIHISSGERGWTRRHMVCFVLCVIFGCLTHNYFYVYAFCVSMVQIIYFAVKRKGYTLINYLLAGTLGLMTVLIIFPWAVWQILFNQQNKHTEISGWDLDKFGELLSFIDEYWFSKHGVIILFVFLICFSFVTLYKKKTGVCSESPAGFFWILTSCSTLLYLVIIFTLDGGRDHYNTPEYLPVILLFSAFIVWVIRTFNDNPLVVLPLLLLSGLPLMGNYTKVYYDYFDDIHPANAEWHAISENYHDCDCLCVGIEELHLMDYSFYEVAQYDEVKAVDAAEYSSCELDTLIGGRVSGDDPVIMYISDELTIPENTTFLMNCRGLNCVYMEAQGE